MKRNVVEKHKLRRIVSAILSCTVVLSTISTATLLYSSAEDNAKVTKSAAWNEGYQESGLATVTLEAHDPQGSGSSETISPVDVTVILDRSNSMECNNSYSYACEAAQNAYNANPSITDEQLYKAVYKALQGCEDTDEYALDNHAFQWQSCCTNENHIYYYKGQWLNNDTALFQKVVQYMNANRNPQTLKDIKCVPFAKGEEQMKFFKSSSNMLLNANDGLVLGSWMSLVDWSKNADGTYNCNGNGGLALDVNDFEKWAKENDKALSMHEDQILHNYAVAHLAPTADGTQYEMISTRQPVQYMRNGVLTKVAFGGHDFLVPVTSDYSRGCSDYLIGAQDGLQDVVELVLGTDGSKMGYMQFGNNDSVMYNNSQYSNDKSKVLNDMVTYRNPESKEVVASNLTPWRVRNSAGTYYSCGLDDAKKLASNLSNANSTQIVLFVSDGTPTDISTSNCKNYAEVSKDWKAAYNKRIKALMDTFKGAQGVKDVHFCTVGINLTEAEASYLISMKDYANTLGNVNGYYGDYINVDDPMKLGEKVKEKITSIASLPATYVDKLSEYFEFPTDGSTYKLTVSDNADYSGGTTVTQSDDVVFNGDTVTWNVPDAKKYSKLEFTIKLKDEYMQSGTDGEVPTNALATFTSDDRVWSDQKTDAYKIDKPKLEYIVGEPKVAKSAAWNQDYLESGQATITLEAHDPRGGGSVETISPVDVTVVLDGSPSMSGNFVYHDAVLEAQKAYNEGKSADEIYQAASSGKDNRIFSHTAGNTNFGNFTMAYCACLEKGHKYIYKLYGLKEDARVAISQYEQSLTETPTKASEIKCMSISSYAVAQKWLGNISDERIVKCTSGSMNLAENNGWCEYTGDLTNYNRAVILDTAEFLKWCNDNKVTIDKDKFLERSYFHLAPNASDSGFDLKTHFETVKYENNKGEMVPVKNSSGVELQVIMPVDYSNGCTDYLSNAEDGLETAIDKIYSNENSRVAFMRFSSVNQSTIYNDGKYYSLDKKNDLRNAVLSHRYPDTQTYTYHRIAFGDGTAYYKGLTDAETIANNLTDANQKHIVLFVSDGSPQDGKTQDDYNSKVKDLMNVIKSKGAKEVYFNSIGISLTDANAKYLIGMADYANKLDGVDAKYSGDYLNITDPAEFGDQIKKIISSIASIPATYTDTLSEYFEFPSDGASFKLTVSDNEDYSGGTVVTESDDVVFNGDTVTWAVQEPKKYNKLEFTVNIKDKKNINSALGTLKDKVATNSAAKFTASQEWELQTPELKLTNVDKKTENSSQSELVVNKGKFKLILDATDLNAKTGVYTADLSQYIEFADATPQYTVTNESDTVDFNGKTITWSVKDTTLDNKLVIDVKLTQAAMDSGVTDVPVNSTAKFVTTSGEWNITYDKDDPRHIENQTVSYKNTDISCVKTLDWLDNTGVAKVTVSPKVQGNSGAAKYTDTIDENLFEIYTAKAPTATDGTFTVAGGQVSWDIPSLDKDGETFTYYIKLKNLHQTATIDDNKEGADGAKLVFDGKTYVEEGVGEDETLAIISTPTLDVKYNPLKVNAKVTDVNRPDSSAVTYTVKDTNKSFSVTVTGNSYGVSDTVDWDSAGSFSFDEYNGATKMVSGDTLTVSELKKSFVAEQKSAVSEKTLTTDILEKDTGNATVTVEFKNDYAVVRTSFKVKKISSNGDICQGAQYSLYEGNSGGTLLASDLVTDSSGIATYSGKLEIGKTYCLVETKAPDGHELKGEEMTFTATVNPTGNLSYSGRDSNTLTYTVTNIRTPEVVDIPSTGGIGLYIVVGAGVLMMLAAAVYLIISRRKNSRDAKNKK